MGKTEIVKAIAEAAGINQKQAAAAFEAVFENILTGVIETGRVAIPDFGVFRKETRAARTGRNPQTGTEIQIPEKTVIKFRPGKGKKQ